MRYVTHIRCAENTTPSPYMTERELINQLIEALDRIPGASAAIDSVEADYPGRRADRDQLAKF